VKVDKASLKHRAGRQLAALRHRVLELPIRGSVPEPQARPRTPRDFYLAMAELMRRIEHSRGITDLTVSELRVTSQNGEDGVIAELLRRIGTSLDPYFIEFGVEDGSEGNCVFLADALGWSGLFLEFDSHQYARLAAKYRWSTGVTTVAAKVTPATVESLFSQSGVPPELDVLSIDVDGVDYWIWRAITNYRPRLVIIEYNAELEPERRQVVPETFEGWTGTNYFGASIGALKALGNAKGYELVYTDLTGVNSFFVRADLLWHPVEPVTLRGPNYFLQSDQHPVDSTGGTYVENPAC